MNTEIILEYTPWVKPADQAVEVSMWRNEAGLAAHHQLLGSREFFEGKSLAELAREQGVGPVEDIGVFAGGFPEYEDLDELLAELDRLRGS